MATETEHKSGADDGVDLSPLKTLDGDSRKAAARGLGVFIREYHESYGEEASPAEETMSAVVTALAATAQRSTTGASIVFAPGDPARDRDRDDKEVLVVATPAVSAADDVVRETGMTVAEHNPEYPERDPVVKAVYVESLDAAFGTGEWTVADVLGMAAEETLEEQGVKRYTFPESRLAPAESEEGSE